MATPNIVPRSDSEGGLGTASKYWASAFIDTINSTVIQSPLVDGDLILKADNGSGVMTAYLTLDGGAGAMVSSKSIYMNDNKRFYAGAGGDLGIHHDGSDSYIVNSSGALIIQNTVNDQDIIFQSDDGNGGTTTYFSVDGSEATYDSGTSATTALYTIFPDKSIAAFGDSKDLQIYHDGSHSRIKDTGTGHLTVNATDFVVNNSADTKNMIIATDGGATSLYCDGSLRLATTSTGVTVSGTLNGITFFSDVTNNSMYTHDPSGNTNYATAQNNTAYGFNAMDAITTGDSNTAIGKDAGGAINSGSSNVAIGVSALSSEDEGDGAVAIGYQALQDQDGGSTFNVAVGYRAGRDVTTGINNVLVGASAGDALTTGNYNVAMGYQALKTEDGHGGNVAIGHQTLENQNAGADAYNVAMGYNAGTNVTTGVYNTIIGGLAGDGVSLGSNNIALGYNSLSATNAGSNSIAIGYKALLSQQAEFVLASGSGAASYNSGSPTISHAANSNVVTGMRVTSSKTGIPANSFVGATVDTGGTNDTFTLVDAAGSAVNATESQTSCTLTFTGGVSADNVAIGFEAGKDTTTGVDNVLIGNYAGTNLTTCIRNTAVGYQALSHETTSGSSVAIGFRALKLQNAGVSTAYNIGIGALAGENISTGVENNLIGALAGDSLTTGSYNVAFGKGALKNEDTGSRNVAIGSRALNSLNYDGDGYNIAIGYDSGLNMSTGINNTLVGGLAGDSLTTGSSNIAIGKEALTTEDTGDRNVAVGQAALRDQNYDGDAYNVAVGYGAGMTVTTGIYNTIMGGLAGDALSSGTRNVAIGTFALSTEDEHSANVAVGYSSLNALNAGVDGYNTAVGYNTGTTVTTGVKNTLIGGLAGDGITLGDHNVALGYAALTAINAGSKSVAIGTGALEVQQPQFTDATCDYNNDPTITHDTNSSILVGMRVTGTGIPANSFVKTKTSNTEFELGNATGDDVSTTGGSVTNGTLTFTGGVDSNNIAIGHLAGNAITTGTTNTLIGSQAGDALTSGTNNVAVGYLALSAQTINGQNTAVGVGALQKQNVSGHGNNTAVGLHAGKEITTGTGNTIIGTSAGDAYTTGSSNVIIGFGAAGAAVSAGNEIIIGANTSGNGSNKITLGDSNINAFHCQVQTIIALSDERDKKDIEDSTYGLEYLESLRPVTFEWDQRDGNRKGLKDLGFIAQEMQDKDDEYTRLVDSNNPDKLQASYGRLIPVLVKAIQELSEEVKALKNK